MRGTVDADADDPHPTACARSGCVRAIACSTPAPVSVGTPSSWPASGYRVAALDVAADEVADPRHVRRDGRRPGRSTTDARPRRRLRGDATHLPFADGTFDGVVTSEVLEHVPDDVGALAELVRVLRPGGVFAATVPSWLPEKINWMLSDEYHAPAAVGGHVRIYSATELKAKLRAAGLRACREPPRPRPALAVLVAEVRRRRQRRRPPAGAPVPPVPRVGHRRAAALRRRRRAGALARCSARASCSTHEGAVMSLVPTLPERAVGAERSPRDGRAPGRAAAAVRVDPVVPRRPLRSVEPRRVGDGPRRRRAAPPGRGGVRVAGSTCSGLTAAGTTTTGRTAASRRTSSTRTCAPTSPLACGTTGAARGTEPSSTTCGRPSSGRSTGRCRLRRPDGLVLWAVEADGTRTWDYALLTGTSSIHHALRCGVALADIVGEPQPGVGAGGRRHGRTPIAERPDAFEPKERWAMDWYYPVLTGALDRRGGQGPPRRGVGRVRDGGPGHPLRERRAVGHGVGDGRVRAGLRRHRRPRHGRPTCWRGPEPTGATTAPTGRASCTTPTAGAIRFPFEEHTSYTAAAVVLAADAIAGASPAAALFTPRPLLD